MIYGWNNNSKAYLKQNWKQKISAAEPSHLTGMVGLKTRKHSGIMYTTTGMPIYIHSFQGAAEWRHRFI